MAAGSRKPNGCTMNYRHGFHAGNFADVLKHIVLARLITYLKRKDQPFRVVDTHAGAGLYALHGDQAARTGEWRDGIGRLMAHETDFPSDVRDLLAPYLESVRAVNSAAELQVYPGSPVIARHLMRRGDHLIANELRADDGASLHSALSGAPATTLMQIDAYVALRALLPPKERRGLVVIDPPFEDRNEFRKLAKGLADARSRFATGTYLVWYPVKDTEAADAFVAVATAHTGAKYLDVRLSICAPFPGLGLTQTGVLVLQPPYTLSAEMAIVLPVLKDILEDGDGAGFRIKSQP